MDTAQVIIKFTNCISNTVRRSSNINLQIISIKVEIRVKEIGNGIDEDSKEERRNNTTLRNTSIEQRKRGKFAFINKYFFVLCFYLRCFCIQAGNIIIDYRGFTAAAYQSLCILLTASINQKYFISTLFGTKCSTCAFTHYIIDFCYRYKQFFKIHILQFTNMNT